MVNQINTPIFGSPDGAQYRTSPTSLLVFIDETGDEIISDPNYHIFGFGGCCILAGEYYTEMDGPLNRICRQYGIPRPLHASSLRNRRTKIVLRNFFENQRFGRLAVIVSDKTINSSVWPLETIVYSMIQLYLAELINSLGLSEIVSDIVFVQEESSRLIPKLENRTISLIFHREFEDQKVEIESHYFKVSKDLCLSGIEIADKIIHVAGTTVRDCHRGIWATPSGNPEFKSILNSIDPDRYSKFFNINDISFNPIENDNFSTFMT